MSRQRIVVLASGAGTLVQALAQADVGADIVAVCSDRADALALRRVPGAATLVLPVEQFGHRSQWDRALADSVAAHDPDWVWSLGFMRLLGPAFLGAFGGRIVNSHPALLPAFPGTHAVRDALAYGVKVTGCTVHLVDSGVDSGPIIAQEAITVDAHEDVAALHERIKVLERRLVVDVAARLVRYGYTVNDRRVSIP